MLHTLSSSTVIITGLVLMIGCYRCQTVDLRTTAELTDLIIGTKAATSVLPPGAPYGASLQDAESLGQLLPSEVRSWPGSSRLSKESSQMVLPGSRAVLIGPVAWQNEFSVH